MRDYRDEFPVTAEWVFFNHAAVAPLCRRARDRMVVWADDMLATGGTNGPAWASQIEAARARAARLINAQPDEIAFLANTTAGIAAVAEGFPWRSGDVVVIPAGEYPSNVYPWMHLGSRGVETRVVATRGARIELADLAAALDERTRLLAISHVQFATGFRSDLAAIGALCRQRGIDFFVDAIQGLGVLPIDVEAMHIDYLSADGHKWLVAPEGASIFYIRRDKLEKIRPTAVGWKSVIGYADYSTIDFRLQPRAARFEGGSHNMPGILALGASLELFEEIGPVAIAAGLKRVTDELVALVPALGGEVVSPRGEGEWSGIVSFTLPGRDARSLVRRARQERVVLAFRDGRIRASPHFYNNSADVDRMIATLSRL